MFLCKETSQDRLFLNISSSSYRKGWENASSQLIFTRSNSTIQTPEKRVKYVQSWQKKKQIDVVMTSYYELWTYFRPFSRVSIFDFEQVNVRLVVEFMFNPCHTANLFLVG